MKRILCIMVVFFGLTCEVKAQPAVDSTDNGIHFEKGLSWQQVLKKAKEEHKYIFVDCYTTWCVPCKKMEMEVYPLKNVGDVYNNKFICVKMQMDTSKNDNEATRASYADASYISRHFKVYSYPTYLFFTPDGGILSNSGGAMGADDFIKLAANVTDSKNDYYKFLDSYNNGKRNLKEMSYLALTSISLGDTVNSQEIQRAYLHNLKKAGWLTKYNIEFMALFTKSTKDIGFALFYKHADSVDKIMDDDRFAHGIVSNLIYNENMRPAMVKADKRRSQPDWAQLTSVIQRKYGKYYANRVIILAKTTWYSHYKNWPEYIKYLVLQTDKYVMTTTAKGVSGSALGLNNNAWDVFQHSQNKSELNSALAWSNQAIRLDPNPEWMDTYANILYKTGKTALAIQWEEVAIKLAPNATDIIANLENMKSGKPTWPEN